MSPPFYTQAAFAALAGVPVHTVAYWIGIGAVESLKLGNTRLVLLIGVNP